MILCIDGGLICVPTMIVLALAGLLGFNVKRMFKWCRKTCDCKCHEKGQK